MRDGWRQTTVGDVLSIDDGPAVDNPWDYELLTVRLHAKGLVPSGRRPNRTAGGRKHFIRSQGQILVGRQNYDRQCVGVVTADLDGHVTSSAITALRPNELAAPGFAELVMASPIMAAAADLAMSGTGQREIGQRALLSLPMLLPPLDEQRRIVDLIGALDDAIEAADASLDGARSVLGQLRAIRTADQYTELGDLATMRSGPSFKAGDVSPTPGTGYAPVIGIPNTPANGHLDLRGHSYVRGVPDSAQRLDSSSLVMIRTNGNRSRIGNVYRVPGEAEGFLVSAFQIAIRPNDPNQSEYLYAYLGSPDVQADISDNASGSTGLGNVAVGWLKKLHIPVLPPEEVAAYVDRCSSADVVIGELTENLGSLRALRANLLTVLLSGEHEIPASYDDLLEAS